MLLQTGYVPQARQAPRRYRAPTAGLRLRRTLLRPGRDFELAARRTKKLFDEEISGDDVYKAIESWGKAASVLPYIGIVAAVMRELKKAKDFLIQEEK